MIEMQVHQLSHRYVEQTVLKSLAFSWSGEVLGISGSNGSGKSTLIRILGGLLTPTRGSVHWTIGEIDGSPSQLRRRMGFAAPYLELYEGLTVRENLRFLCDLRRITPSDRELDLLLEQVQATPFAERLYGELSTGQRQRAKIGSALLHQPAVLCLDEPGSNLDAGGRQRIAEIIGQLRSPDRTILVATNQSDELALCDAAINLSNSSPDIQPVSRTDT
ncbi:MAG: ABC transporter ATP-binding protein [Bacteroidota bacterium]